MIWYDSQHGNVSAMGAPVLAHISYCARARYPIPGSRPLLRVNIEEL